MSKKKKIRYAFKRDYEAPVKEFYPRDIYLPGTGIGKKVTVPDTMGEFERYKSLDYYKDLLRLCVKCGNCRYVFRDWNRACPSGEFGGFESYYLGGKNVLLWGLTRGKIKWSKPIVEVFYHCMLCGNCQVQCQIPEIHHYAMEWLEAAREKAVELGIGPMPGQLKMGRYIMKEHNPYMELHRKRLDWLPVSKESLPKKAEIAFFVGCTPSYVQTHISTATFEILKKLNANFTILNDEYCCGSPAQQTGQRKIAMDCARHNIKELEKTGASTVITSCPGCYRMLKEDYKKRYKFNVEAEIIHSATFFNKLLKKGVLKFGNNIGKVITYHDPCHLGRYSGIYEDPRDLLQNMPGVKVIEMPRNKQNAWCCGGGGGVKAGFPRLSSFAASERVKEAKETGAEAIVSSCPFCYINLSDSIEQYNEKMEVYDVVDLINMSIK